MILKTLRKTRLLIYVGQQIKTDVVFLNKREDIALLQPWRESTKFYWSKPCPNQTVSKKLWSYNLSFLGIGWESDLEFVGRFNAFKGEFGPEVQSIVIFRGIAFDGSSGSIVWDLENRCSVGMIRDSLMLGALETLVEGVPSDIIDQAIKRFDKGEKE